MESKLFSPNELLTAGKDIMLGGVAPKDSNDWNKIVHFWAANISASLLPSTIELLCVMFRVPLDKEVVLSISKYYKELAIKKQEEELQKIIGQPVTHNNLKHLRSIISENLEYGEIIKIFKKAQLQEAWPNHESWEAWGKLCNALFLMKDDVFKKAQQGMMKVIKGGK